MTYSKTRKPTVCGVGYKSSTSTTEVDGSRKTYSVWKNMIYRCYDKNHKDYKHYGGKGVTVHPEWHYFDKFREDIVKLPGYNEELFFKNKLFLDKDGLSGETLIYSKDTCQLLTTAEHFEIPRSEYTIIPKTKVIALSPDNETIGIINIPLFAEAHGFDQSHIYSMLNRKQKTLCYGWCFQRVTDTKSVNIIDSESFILPPRKYIRQAFVAINICDNSEIYLHDSDEASKFASCSKSTIIQNTRTKGFHLYGNYKIIRAEHPKKERKTI